MELAILYVAGLFAFGYFFSWLRRRQIRFISQEIKDIITHYMSYK